MMRKNPWLYYGQKLLIFLLNAVSYTHLRAHETS